LTASNFGAATGKSLNYGKKKGKTPEDVADGITGIRPFEFDAESQRVMEIGRRQEPIARNWYSQSRGVNVREVGLAVPKWFPFIGASLDGEVLEIGSNGEIKSTGMIEIKCPEKMYAPLIEYTQSMASGWKPPPKYHQHIWKTHYDQMQGCMAICNKHWCDYIVFCEQQNNVFVQRLEFDREYWEKSLYPQLKNFVEQLLIPRLKTTGKVPLCPSEVNFTL
jgi:hypothetical protein